MIANRSVFDSIKDCSTTLKENLNLNHAKEQTAAIVLLGPKNPRQGESG